MIVLIFLYNSLRTILSTSWVFLLNTQKQMAHSAKLVIALIHIFAWSFLDILEISNGTETDIYCLRSIKESLEDPYNYFKSWNFINNTEGFICDFVGVECWNSDENKVFNIKLKNMGLKGHFPREIENCTLIKGLDQSGNELTGTYHLTYLCCSRTWPPSTWQQPTNGIYPSKN